MRVCACVFVYVFMCACVRACVYVCGGGGRQVIERCREEGEMDALRWYTVCLSTSASECARVRMGACGVRTCEFARARTRTCVRACACVRACVRALQVWVCAHIVHSRSSSGELMELVSSELVSIAYLS